MDSLERYLSGKLRRGFEGIAPVRLANEGNLHEWTRTMTKNVESSGEDGFSGENREMVLIIIIDLKFKKSRKFLMIIIN